MLSFDKLLKIAEETGVEIRHNCTDMHTVLDASGNEVPFNTRLLTKKTYALNSYLTFSNTIADSWSLAEKSSTICIPDYMSFSTNKSVLDYESVDKGNNSYLNPPSSTILNCASAA